MPSAPDDAFALGRLRPPACASPAGLTAWATDDLAAQPWVTLHSHRLPFPPPAFWYVVEHLTVDRHWNRTIFAQALLEAEHVDVATARVVDAAYAAPPPPRTRVHALRLLRRKTPAPVGGPSDQDGRAYDAHEWTAQWTEGDDDGGDSNDAHGRDHDCHMDCDCVHDRDRDTDRDRDIDAEHDAADQRDSEPARHIACFGLSLPESVVTPDNPRALRYWPFQYPKARCYRFVYERWSDDGGDNNNENQSDMGEVVEGEGDWVLRYEVVPLGDEARSPREFATLLRHARPAAVKMVQHLRKRMKHFDVTLGTSTYVKRVTHDHMISEAAFRRWYDALKLRHAPQIQGWLAMPDVVLLKPYEELSIAAYLCALWEAERAAEPSRYDDSSVDSAEADNDDEGATKKRKKQTFVDVGCGNGLLVYLLLGEGHVGCGYDLQKRPIWDLYPQDVRDALHHQAIDPATFDCSPYDWIIGNHSDELSPWVPVMAARAQARVAAASAEHNNDDDDEYDDDNACLVAEEEVKRPMCDAPDTLRREEGRDDDDDDEDGSTDVDTARPRLQRMRLRRAYPRFIVIPCCFFDFDGRKLAFGHTRRTIGVRAPHGMGKYEQYYRWIEKIMRTFGFTVEYENLRIPSTKYVSLMGRFVQYEPRIEPRVIDEMTSLVMLDARQSHM